MIDVYNFLNLATDLSGCRIKVYDFTSEKVIFDSDNHPDDDPVMEIYLSPIGDYEVESYDIYLENGRVCFEINIELDEEEFEDEEDE